MCAPFLVKGGTYSKGELLPVICLGGLAIKHHSFAMQLCNEEDFLLVQKHVVNR